MRDTLIKPVGLFVAERLIGERREQQAAHARALGVIGELQDIVQAQRADARYDRNILCGPDRQRRNAGALLPGEISVAAGGAERGNNIHPRSRQIFNQRHKGFFIRPAVNQRRQRESGETFKHGISLLNGLSACKFLRACHAEDHPQRHGQHQRANVFIEQRRGEREAEKRL